MPAPPDDPTAAELEAAALAHDYCSTLARYGCPRDGGTSFVSDLLANCSDEERLAACEQDVLIEYYQWAVPGCEAEWQAAIRCLTATSFEESCDGLGLLTRTFGVDICIAEKDAFSACSDDGWESVTGPYGTCSYGPGTFSECEISCPVGDNYFAMSCGGHAGLPVRCSCTVNGHSIGDRNFVQTEVFYADDCGDAAARAASGKCTNRLDCCFRYSDGGEDQCLCGSDPSLMGDFSTCEELAASVGGTVVDICPQYEASFPGCWPPPCGS